MHRLALTGAGGCAHTTYVWLACDRIASPACFPYCHAAQPNKLQPCAHLTTLHACDRTTAPACLLLRAAEPCRLQSCALTTIWFACDRPAESAYRSLSRSPTFTGRAVCVHANCVARLRPHRGVNLPLLPHRSALIGCDRALILLCGTLLPHSGASLLFMAAQPSTRRLRPRAHLTNMAR